MIERTALKMVARSKRIGALLSGVALFLLLASCTPNTSPATRSSGPVVISTDHSVYATTERIQVTVTNHLPVSMYAYDHQASCSILGLEMQVNGQWQPSYSARCATGRLNMQIRIASGQSYTATIQAGETGEPGPNHATFFPGRYRLVLTYSTVATGSREALLQDTTIYSATFTIQGDAPEITPPPSSGATPIHLPIPATPVPTP